MSEIKLFPVVTVEFEGFTSYLLTVCLAIAILAILVAIAAKSYSKGGHFVLGSLAVAVVASFAESWLGGRIAPGEVFSYWGMAAIWAGTAGALYGLAVKKR